MSFLKKIFLILVSVVIISCGLSLGVYAAEPTEQSEDTYEFSGREYKLFNEGMTWNDAKKYCESIGGHLVTITTEEEQWFIEDLLSECGSKNNYWIGAESINGYFEWVTNERFDYSNWAPSQPDHDFEDKVHLYNVLTPNDNIIGQWNNLVNEGVFEEEEWFGLNNFGFICEWGVDDTVEDPNEGKIIIHDRRFDTGIDYYISEWGSDWYNPALSNMLAALSVAAYDEAEIEEAYEALGFRMRSCANDYYTKDPDSCGYNIGVKVSEYNDDLICLIVVRGSQTVSDWIGNINISTTFFEGKHTGFLNPAKNIFNRIESILGDNMKNENVKYVITGHSRGGAVANLLSVELMENDVETQNVYNYNYACPDVASKFIFPNYDNIFNLCNRLDIVPLLPGHIGSAFAIKGKSWGKYGQTYWFTASSSNENPADRVGENHSIALYLRFFDHQLYTDEWPCDASDKIWDCSRVLVGFIAKISCPVDVVVTDESGNSIASVIDGKINYYDSNFGDVVILTDGDVKVIYIDGDYNFNISLIGTGSGTMNYAIEKCDLLTAEVIESKIFDNVVLEAGKEMYSPVSRADDTSKIGLFVVEERDGEIIYTHTINESGIESEIYNPDNDDVGDGGFDGEDDLDFDSESEEEVYVNENNKIEAHSCKKVSRWKRFWNGIGNFFRRLFGRAEKCVCGERKK